MTQIQPFPTGLFPAIAMALAEGDELSADPAAFRALAGEGMTSPQGEAETVVSVPPLSAVVWPLAPPAMTAASSAPFAAMPEAQVQMAPEAAVAPSWPWVTEAAPLPLPEMAAPAEEAALDLLPEAEAPDPATPLPLVAPVVAPAPFAEVVAPVQAGTAAMAPAAPVRVEIAVSAPVPEDAAAAGPSDPVARKQPDHDPVLPSAPAAVVTAESPKVIAASPVDAGAVELQKQDAFTIPAASMPQDPILAEPTVASAMLVAPAKTQNAPPAPAVSGPQAPILAEPRTAPMMQTAPAPAPLETPAPPTSGPVEPAVAAAVAAVDKAPAAERKAERAGDRTAVAASPEIWIADRSASPLPQPAMAREERLWRSLWPAAEARPASPAVAAETAVPAADKGAVFPAMPASADAPAVVDVPVIAEAEEKTVESPETASSPVKPESAAAVPERAGAALPGPVNAPPAALPGAVLPMGDPVPQILHAARDLPAAPVQAPPAPPVQVQIVQALSSGGGAVTELRLAPEELGHVRIDMRHEGDRLVMVVSAERQDTLDLLRRHAGELAADLRAAGHSGLDLSFGQWTGPGTEAEGNPDGLTEAEMTWPDVPQDPARAAFKTQPHQPVGGLYLRI